MLTFGLVDQIIRMMFDLLTCRRFDMYVWCVDLLTCRRYDMYDVSTFWHVDNLICMIWSTIHLTVDNQVVEKRARQRLSSSFRRCSPASGRRSRWRWGSGWPCPAWWRPEVRGHGKAVSGRRSEAGSCRSVGLWLRDRPSTHPASADTGVAKRTLWKKNFRRRPNCFFLITWVLGLCMTNFSYTYEWLIAAPVIR
jgi:hypothetical protein